MIEKTCRVVGSGSAPSNITSIVDQCSIKCGILSFKLKALQFYDIVDDDSTRMEWDAIIMTLKTKYLSLESHNLWSTKATNAKENLNELAGLHSNFNKLTTQVVAQAPQGAGPKYWTCGLEHVQSDCPMENDGGKTSWKRIPPGSVDNGTKMVEGVSWTYCGQFRHWTTCPKEHSTTTNIRKAIPLENPRGSNPPASPNQYPDPPAGSLAQARPYDSVARGFNTKASMAADLGGDPNIGGNSAYGGSSLSLMGHIFIGGAVNSESEPPTSDDVYVGAPYFCFDDIFFRDDFFNKLYDAAFYDAVETLHKNVTLATDTAVSTSADEAEAGPNEYSSGLPDSRELTHPPSNHQLNQDSKSSDSEDEPEPPDHTAPGNCRQCGAYRWLGRDCTQCNGVYEPVD